MNQLLSNGAVFRFLSALKDNETEQTTQIVNL